MHVNTKLSSHNYNNSYSGVAVSAGEADDGERVPAAPLVNYTSIDKLFLFANLPQSHPLSVDVDSHRLATTHSSENKKSIFQ